MNTDIDELGNLYYSTQIIIVVVVQYIHL